MANIKKIGMLFAVISAVSWGAYGSFSTLLLEGGLTNAALVALAPLSLVLYFGFRVLTAKPRVLKNIRWQYYVGMALQGFIIVNAMNYCYTAAYSAGMPVGIVSTVAFTNVLIIMLESYWLFKYKFTGPKIISMLFALLGVALVLDVFGGLQGGVTPKGIFWTLLIPLFFGTNVTLNTFFIVKKVDSDAILFITQGFALIFMFLFQINPLTLLQDITILLSQGSAGVIPLLGFCLIPEIICFAAMQECLKRIEPSIMGIVYALDPVTSLLLGLIIFGQGFGFLQIIGILCVLLAVAYINYAEAKEIVNA